MTLPVELKKTLLDMSPLHFIGAAGSGMRPLALFAHAAGAVVAGSDSSEAPEGGPIRIDRDGSTDALNSINVAKTVIYSSAIKSDHPALTYAAAGRKVILHRSEFLGLLTGFFRTISVGGTHGKSTVSALITHILRRSGHQPSWIIGAPFANGVDSFGLGAGRELVIEADESDATFLRYKTHIGVINNIAPDHLDFYGDMSRLRAAFADFAQSITTNGCCIYFADDTDSRGVTNHASCRKITFGSGRDCDVILLDWQAQGLESVINGSFAGDVIRFSVPLTGRHNALNVLAAMLVAQQMGISPAASAEFLKDFPGVARRLQRYQGRSNALIFDDYAHNPGKISGCLLGLRSAFPSRRILAVFQPHRYSRLSSLYLDFSRAFTCDNTAVIVLPVYAAGELANNYPPLGDLAADIETGSHVKTFSVTSLKGALNLVNSMLEPEKDIVVTLGAGDVWKVAQSLSNPVD